MEGVHGSNSERLRETKEAVRDNTEPNDEIEFEIKNG